MAKFLVFVLLFNYCSGVLYYDAYSDTPITKEELKRRDKLNTTIWCVTELEPCDPNEGRRIDGSCNNLKHPSRGASHTPFLKLLPSVFDKGFEPRQAKSGGPLPLARKVRTRLLSTGTVPSIRLTQLAIHFLIFIVADIVSQHDTVNYVYLKPYCCDAKGKTDHACVPLKIPDDDPVHRFSSIRCLNMTRPESYQSVGCVDNNTVPERITSSTPFFDLSGVYGSSLKSKEKLRKYEGGLLKFDVSNGRIWPPNAKNSPTCTVNQPPAETRCHDTPDDSPNSLAGINLFSIWFWRMHNHIASELSKINPCWDDDKLFTVARDINIAIAFQMYYYEIAPLLLGHENLIQAGVISPSLGFREIYDENVIPQISLEYPYALRWLHTMQEGRLKMYDTKGHYLKEVPIVNMTLRTGYFDVDDNIVYMTQGSFRQASAAYDYVVDPDIADKGMGPVQQALDISTNDLAKARYFGFQPYNKFREFCFKKPIKRFEDLEDAIDSERLELLKDSYKDLEDIDLLAGIWTEKPIPGGHVPSTFYCLVVDQMVRSVVMDRHWFERENRPNAFNLSELLEIRNVTMAKFLCTVGDSVTEIQPEPFLRAGAENKMQSCNEIGKIDFSTWSDASCQQNNI